MVDRVCPLSRPAASVPVGMDGPGAGVDPDPGLSGPPDRAGRAGRAGGPEAGGVAPGSPDPR
jgi:hypothetical protein